METELEVIVDIVGYINIIYKLKLVNSFLQIKNKIIVRDQEKILIC